MPLLMLSSGGFVVFFIQWDKQWACYWRFAVVFLCVFIKGWFIYTCIFLLRFLYSCLVVYFCILEWLLTRNSGYVVSFWQTFPALCITVVCGHSHEFYKNGWTDRGAVSRWAPGTVYRVGPGSRLFFFLPRAKDKIPPSSPSLPLHMPLEVSPP